VAYLFVYRGTPFWAFLKIYINTPIQYAPHFASMDDIAFHAQLPSEVLYMVHCGWQIIVNKDNELM
jgi:hypothetical protein